jgi:hypothetical protein
VKLIVWHILARMASVARTALKALKVTVSFEDARSDKALQFRGSYLGEKQSRGASIARGNGLR